VNVIERGWVLRIAKAKGHTGNMEEKAADPDERSICCVQSQLFCRGLVELCLTRKFGVGLLLSLMTSVFVARSCLCV
jgi:hypothetical protein